MSNNIFYVGQTVYSNTFGKGEVTLINDHSGYSISVLFEKKYGRDKVTYHFTEEGEFFIGHGQDLFPYAPFLENQRLIEVQSNPNGDWEKRVLFKFKDGKALCWSTCDSLENLDEYYTRGLVEWEFWREIPEESIVELTFQDISDGKGVGIDPKLIRIKE